MSIEMHSLFPLFCLNAMYAKCHTQTPPLLTLVSRMLRLLRITLASIPQQSISPHCGTARKTHVTHSHLVTYLFPFNRIGEVISEQPSFFFKYKTIKERVSGEEVSGIICFCMNLCLGQGMHMRGPTYNKAQGYVHLELVNLIHNTPLG